MRIFNSDGSEPEMCGNGIRCYAKFVAQLEGTKAKQTYQIQTLAGMICPKIEASGEVTVNMGQPRLLASELPTTLTRENEKVIQHPLEVMGRTWEITCVSMGNPHCITFVDQVDEIPLEGIGTQFEHHPAFPQRINTEFIEVVRPDYLKMRVWERGAGITLACGTGACAAVVAGVLTQKCDRACMVQLPGGDLKIHWSADDNNVYMTGAAEEVFTGQYSV
jgi:diaminopimelate epimerase